LQPYQLAAQCGGDRLGDLGLADTRLAFEKERLAEFQRQKGDGAQIAPAHVILPLEERDRLVNAAWERLHPSSLYCTEQTYFLGARLSIGQAAGRVKTSPAPFHDDRSKRRSRGHVLPGDSLRLVTGSRGIRENKRLREADHAGVIPEK
jgi:hypothetical protein